jgi:alpha-1,2-mannosyltransferase
VPSRNAAGPTRPTSRQHVLGRLIYSHSAAAVSARRVVAVLGVVLGLAHLKIPLGSLLPEYIYSRDVLQGYVLAKAILDGADPYLPMPQLVARYVGGIAYAELPHATPHPPMLGLLLAPLSLLDYPTAAAVWIGLELTCLIASVYLPGRALDTHLSMRVTLGIAAVLLMWYPMWVEMFWGQLQLPMLALLSGAWVALRSGRSALGGALVGLAILLKPIPLPLLLLFVLWKDWHALAAALFGVSAGYLTASFVVGLDKIETYFTVVLLSVTSIYRASWGNVSISSLGWRLFDGTQATTTTGYALAPP